MLHILVMKIGSTVLLLIPYRFHIIFEPAHLQIACRQVRLSVCRQAGTPADRSAGKLDGRSVGARSVCRQAGTPADRSAGKLDGRQVGARACLQASVCMPCLYAFVYCTIPLLLHYYVDRRMYCTTDLYHSNSTSLKPQSIADTFIWSFAVVNLHNNTTANQHIIETMLLPICIELLSWLSGSVLCCFLSALNYFLGCRVLFIVDFVNHWFAELVNKRGCICPK